MYCSSSVFFTQHKYLLEFILLVIAIVPLQHFYKPTFPYKILAIYFCLFLDNNESMMVKSIEYPTLFIRSKKYMALIRWCNSKFYLILNNKILNFYGNKVKLGRKKKGKTTELWILIVRLEIKVETNPLFSYLANLHHNLC